MERPESIKPTPPGHRQERQREAIKLIVIFHLVGLVGFLMPALNPLFLKLVPWHLLFMFAILVFNYRRIDKKFILFILLTYLLGYVAEWIGVNKHWFFGNYTYGTTLGITVFGVPLIIGVNWFMLTWSAGVLMQRTKLNNPALRIVAGSFLLVLLDFLIEPVAVHFDYWYWTESTIPLENYVCWFLLSGLMLALFELLRFRKQSMVGPVFLAVEFAFFAILYFTVR